ncbi:magnesium chelatase domain-containing protein [Longispora sp. NPDC051575]|uniref:magnesium chelatase domain-containing protein n=1 Tax=Longispora sp. NPDC051575 TaxID=3154943 RepID=UPI0034440F48
MGYARVHAIGLTGVRGYLVEVEADVRAGLPGLLLTGLPDTALNQARDRVRAAIVNCGEEWPSRHAVVNLLPASQPKSGSGFDLAIAVALLCAQGALPAAVVADTVFLGELGLDGQVRPVRGTLPAVLAAARAGMRRVVVPLGNACEAALVPGILVKAVDDLGRLIAFARGAGQLLDPPEETRATPARGPDLADIAGQEDGRRGLEVAAAGVGKHGYQSLRNGSVRVSWRRATSEAYSVQWPPVCCHRVAVETLSRRRRAITAAGSWAERSRRALLRVGRE